MAGRTMTRFAAAVALTAAALSPGFALQPPTAPPPRPKPPEAPAPRQITRETSRLREVFEFRQVNGVQAAECPAPRAVRGGGQELRLVEIVCGPQAGGCCTVTAAPAGGPLAGTWYRELPGTVLAFTFAADELTATATLDADGLRGCVTLTADYAVAKDGTVHGVVTGADVTAAGGLSGLELVSVAMAAQEMVGRPFAFRAKPTAGGVMISNIRLSLPGELGGDELAKLPGFAAGQYRRANDVAAVPAPKSATGVYLQSVYSSDPNVRQLVRPVGGKCDCTASPADVLPAAATPPYPPYPPGPCPGLQFAPPAAGKPCDVNSGGGLSGALVGNLFGWKETCPGGMPVPSVRYLEHPPQFFAPDLAFPLPRELHSQLAAGAVVPNPAVPGTVLPNPLPPGCPPPGMPCPVQPAGFVPPPPPIAPSAAGGLPAGTWYRDLGPMRYVLKFHDGRMTVTATMTAECEVGVVSSGLTWTADLYPTRDGSGVVGVVTSLDAVLDGPVPASAYVDDLSKRLPRVQKAVACQPLAFTLRVDGDALTIGDVRIAGLEVKDAQDQEMMQGLGMLGGRYRVAGTKPLPKVTPIMLNPNAVPSGPPAVMLPPPPGVPYAVPVPPPGCLPAPPVVYGPPAGFPPGPAVLPPCAAPVPAPCPVMAAGGPPPDLIPPTKVPPPPAPRPAPPAFTPSGIVGEWHRTIGHRIVGLTVGPQRLTVRVTGTMDGDPFTAVVTADHKELRDGQVVGVVTSAECETGSPDDLGGLRLVVDQPFSCRYRLVDDELIVIDLKVGGLKLSADELGVAAGRYKKGKPTPPAPANGKNGAATGGFGTVTRTRVVEAAGGLVGAGTGGMIGDAVDRQEAKVTPARLGMIDVVRMVHQGHSAAVIITQIRNTGSTFRLAQPDLDFLKASNVPDRVITAMLATRGPQTPGTSSCPPDDVPPPMAPPVPLPTAPGAKAGLRTPPIQLNRYVAVPNGRMQELLEESEDLRKIGQEWARFWFNDRPKHPTPDRVPGGVR